MYKTNQVFLFGVQGYVWNERRWERGLCSTVFWELELQKFCHFQHRAPKSASASRSSWQIGRRKADGKRQGKENTHAF